MSIYNVYQPPLRATQPEPDPARFAFVRDNFSFWAFVFGPLWMLWHRLWLVFVIYVVLMGGAELALVRLGASAGSLALLNFLVAVLIALEAGTLRHLTLRRRGWRNVGVVSGGGLEEAERRFFDAWLRRTRTPDAPPAAVQHGAGSPSSNPAPAAARLAPGEDVVGLFPEPGAGR